MGKGVALQREGFNSQRTLTRWCSQKAAKTCPTKAPTV